MVSRIKMPKLLLYFVGTICVFVVNCVRFHPYNQDIRKIEEKRIQVELGDGLGRIQGWDINLGWNFERYKHMYYFFGIPYAKPPIRDLRLRPPEPPDSWHGVYDATYFRPACPQNPIHIKPYVKKVNISEDCLYLNVYAPFYPDGDPQEGYKDNKKYPVLFYIHGGQFRYGSGQLFPGNILAEENMVVVTFNYRLNGLGFLSSNDENSPGNYGFLDMIKALEFVKEQIEHFRGNSSSVDLVGHEAGAIAANLLALSPKSRHLFRNVIAMSGSDLCETAVVQPQEGAVDYAKDLAKKIGCPFDNVERMVLCLRYSRTAQEIANASDEVTVKQWYQGWTGGPWAAVIGEPSGFLPKSPKEMREENDFKQIQYYMSGLSKDAGAAKLPTLGDFDDGVSRYKFREVMGSWIRRYRGVLDVERTVDAIELEYTYWMQPDNDTARRQMLIALWTDYEYGSCVDGALKYYAKHSNNITMYVFDHRSKFATTPEWMGVDHGSELPYITGVPYMNDPVYNTTGLKLTFDYDELDKNVSELMINCWGDFVKYQNATLTPIKNMTWLPFLLDNLTYCTLENHSYVQKNYRQDHYAFWREYFPVLALRPIYTTTEYPTRYPPIELRISTWVLGGVTLILLIVALALIITLCKRKKESELY